MLLCKKLINPHLFYQTFSGKTYNRISNTLFKKYQKLLKSFDFNSAHLIHQFKVVIIYFDVFIAQPEWSDWEIFVKMVCQKDE